MIVHKHSLEHLIVPCVAATNINHNLSCPRILTAVAQCGVNQKQSFVNSQPQCKCAPAYTGTPEWSRQLQAWTTPCQSMPVPVA